MDYSFRHQIDQFSMQVDAMRETIDILVGELTETLKARAQKFTEWVRIHATKNDQSEDDKMKVTIAPKLLGELERQLMELSSVGICFKMLPRTFVVSLISIFDAYIGRLVRGILLTEPGVLRTSEKTLSYSDLLSFASFREAREVIIEREIEDLLRKSHSDQFDWLEKRLAIPLRKDLCVWADFIELTERRNLYVHADGIVSNQYLRVCEKNKVKFDRKPKVGDDLSVTRDYFIKSCTVVSEIGIKLGHVIWRKLKPADCKEVDNSLNNLCVRLISNERHALAIRVLEFVVNCEAWKSAMEARLYYELNLAQAYKWNGQGEKCKEIMALRDYSTLSDKYKLAHAVLSDDFAESARIMKKIGKSKEISAPEYGIWPIFREFRKDPIFEETYEQVFGEKFKTELERPVDTRSMLNVKKLKSQRKSNVKSRKSHNRQSV